MKAIPCEKTVKKELLLPKNSIEREAGAKPSSKAGTSESLV